MRSVSKALKTFFGGFGLPAYSSDTVPDDVQLPYITYLNSEPRWDSKATMYCMVWYRSRSNDEVLAKADQIVAAIGVADKLIELDGGGYLVIRLEAPQVQLQVNGDARAAYINMSINAYHLPGSYPEEGENEDVET